MLLRVAIEARWMHKQAVERAAKVVNEVQDGAKALRPSESVVTNGTQRKTSRLSIGQKLACAFHRHSKIANQPTIIYYYLLLISINLLNVY